MRWYEYKMEVDDLHASDDLKAKLLAMQPAEEAPKPARKPKKAIHFPRKTLSIAACGLLCGVGLYAAVHSPFSLLPAGGAGQVVAAVDGHTQQPGFQVFLALEAAIVAQQLFENILHHIFRIGGAAAVVHGGSEHRVTVSLHGQRKNLVFGQLSHSSMLL